MRRPLLLSTLLALGVMPVLPPPRREVDLPAAEKLIADLQAAGIDACEMADLTGAVDFVTKGRAVLELHSTLLSQGQRVTDVAVLLRELENLTIESRHDAGAAAISPGVAVGPNGKWIAVFEPQTIDLNPAYESGTREATIAIDGVPIAHVTMTDGAIGLDDVVTQRHRINPPFAQAEAFRARMAEPAPASIGIAIRAAIDRARTVIRQSRDRPEQRAAKKTRARIKARRGY